MLLTLLAGSSWQTNLQDILAQSSASAVHVAGRLFTSKGRLLVKVKDGRLAFQASIRNN